MEQKIQEYSEKIQNAIDEKAYDKALSLADELMNINEAGGHYWKAVIYLNSRADEYLKNILDSEGSEDSDENDSLWEQALNEINRSIELYNSETNHYNYCRALLTKAEMLARRGEVATLAEGRNLAILLMQTDHEDIAKAARKIFSDISDNLQTKFNRWSKTDDEIAKINAAEGTEENKKKAIAGILKVAEEWRFTHQPFQERQLLFFVRDMDAIAGCVDDKDNIQWIFTLDETPKELTFPTGHPQANTLYIAHPAKKGFYLPFERAEE